jgi:hypothetical protein
LVLVSITAISCDNSGVESEDGADKNDASMQMPAYYDLQTKKPIEVTRDFKANVYVDVYTHKLLKFFYDATAHDTFDNHGRIVNHALIIKDHNYWVDEQQMHSNADAYKSRTDSMDAAMGE